MVSQDQLPYLKMTGAKTSCYREQIIAPHAIEPFTVSLFYPLPVGLEIPVPGQNGLFIIDTEILPIFHDEQRFDSRSDLSDGR
jgi:hypothetical protein